MNGITVFPHQRLLSGEIYIDKKYITIKNEYEEYHKASMVSASLEEKVALYENYGASLKRYENAGRKLFSSLSEEFLIYLFKDIPILKERMESNELQIGPIITRLFPQYTYSTHIDKNWIKKNQDFCIFRPYEEGHISLPFPLMIYECKTDLPVSYLEESKPKAAEIKKTYPDCIYNIVSGYNALSSYDASGIDQIYILRGRNKNIEKLIDFDAINDLYNDTKKHLETVLLRTENHSETGRLLKRE